MGDASAPATASHGSLRISFVALNYLPSVGGAQEHIRQLAEGLAAKGHDVEVITTDARRSPTGKDPGAGLAPHEEIGGVSVRRHRSPEIFRHAQRYLRWASVAGPWAPDDSMETMTSPWLAGPPSPGLWRSIRRAVRTRDVVVGCSAPFLTLVLPPLVRTRRHARVVAMPLLHASLARPNRWVRRALRRSDATTASTPFERDIHLSIGVPEAKVVVQPPGTDPSGFPALDPVAARAAAGLPERPTVGFVGRLAAYKGIDTLLDAAPLLWERHPDLTVLVAGSVVGWSGHRSHPSTADPKGRVVIREDFLDGERASLISACDVVAFPSRDESFGLAIVEAWAARRPVVAADIPVVRGIVRPGIDAELVPVGDPRALADAISGLLDAPERAREMGAAGRRHVEADLTWAAIVDGWDSFVHEVAGDGALAATGRRGRA